MSYCSGDNVGLSQGDHNGEVAVKRCSTVLTWEAFSYSKF